MKFRIIEKKEKNKSPYFYIERKKGYSVFGNRFMMKIFLIIKMKVLPNYLKKIKQKKRSFLFLGGLVILKYS